MVPNLVPHAKVKTYYPTIVFKYVCSGIDLPSGKKVPCLYRLMAPSTSTDVPVMKLAAGDSRKHTIPDTWRSVHRENCVRYTGEIRGRIVGGYIGYVFNSNLKVNNYAVVRNIIIVKEMSMLMLAFIENIAM